MLALLAPPKGKHVGEPLLLIYLCLAQQGWRISHEGSHKTAFFRQVVASFPQKNGNAGHLKAEIFIGNSNGREEEISFVGKHGA